MVREYAGVAQLEEFHRCKLVVVGSSPTSGSNIAERANG